LGLTDQELVMDEELFRRMLPLIDAQITMRLAEFHQALLDRGQISRPPHEESSSDIVRAALARWRGLDERFLEDLTRG
jgi:hypothetical protein